MRLSATGDNLAARHETADHHLRMGRDLDQAKD